MNDLAKRLEIKASMIELCEQIAWGSDSAIMREAAAELRRMSAELAALRTADTCARQCEAQAYWHEAQRQKRRAETAEQARCRALSGAGEGGA